MDNDIQKIIKEVENCDVCGMKGNLIPLSKQEIIDVEKVLITKFVYPNNHEYQRKIRLK